MSQWATTVARRRRRGHFSSSLGLVNRHAPVEQPALPVECQLDEPGWIAPVPDDMVDEARRVVPEDAVHPAAQRYVALVGPVRSGSRLPPVIDMTLFAGLRVGRAVHLDDPGVLHRRTGIILRKVLIELSSCAAVRGHDPPDCMTGPPAVVAETVAVPESHPITITRPVSVARTGVMARGVAHRRRDFKSSPARPADCSAGPPPWCSIPPAWSSPGPWPVRAPRRPRSR